MRHLVYFLYEPFYLEPDIQCSDHLKTGLLYRTSLDSNGPYSKSGQKIRPKNGQRSRFRMAPQDLTILYKFFITFMYKMVQLSGILELEP
jgi:hypothetical protein